MAEHLLVGAVTNGEYKKTQASQDTTKAKETTSTSKSEGQRDTGYNKDMFLQLLVAEMQYQDPLEPSDNSQYVAQLASFTQIEAMQAVQDNMDTIQSNSIVGKVVALNINGQEITGRVDFTTKDDKKGTMLSVDGELYEMSKMVSVIDEDYYNAKYISNLFTDAVKKLPDPELVTVRDEQVIAEATQILNSMNAYDQSFVEADIMKKYQGVFAQYAKLIEALNNADKENKEKETNNTAGVESTEQTENSTSGETAEKTDDTTAVESTLKPEEENSSTDTTDESTDEMDISDAVEI